MKILDKIDYCAVFMPVLHDKNITQYVEDELGQVT